MKSGDHTLGSVYEIYALAWAKNKENRHDTIVVRGNQVTFINPQNLSNAFAAEVQVRDVTDEGTVTGKRKAQETLASRGQGVKKAAFSR